jgi:hypothetical protein
LPLQHFVALVNLEFEVGQSSQTLTSNAAVRIYQSFNSRQALLHGLLHLHE